MAEVGTAVNPTKTPRRRLRLRAAADYIGCSAASLGTSRWRQALGIPAYRLNRVLVFDVDELDAWLAQRRELPPRDAA